MPATKLLSKIYPNINDDCMFKIHELEPTPCNDCGHTTNNDVVCNDWLQLEDSSNLQTSGMLHQLIGPRGEHLENYRFVDGFQKLNAVDCQCYTVI